MSYKRKMSKKSYGGYKLISVKEFGPWEGLVWVKAKSLKEFDATPQENQVFMEKCPKDTPMMCFPADGYPNVRSECKSCCDMEGNDDGNCPFLFRYASGGMYGCRFIEKNADRLIYDYRGE